MANSALPRSSGAGSGSPFFLERWEVDCAGAVDTNGNCPEAGANDGTYQISYDFTARRVR